MAVLMLILLLLLVTLFLLFQRLLEEATMLLVQATVLLGKLFHPQIECLLRNGMHGLSCATAKIRHPFDNRQRLLESQREASKTHRLGYKVE